MIRPRLKLLSYRNQLIDLLYNLIYRFLYHGNIGCHFINSIIFFLNIESGKVSAEYYGNIAFMAVEDLCDRADLELKDPTQIGVLDNRVFGNLQCFEVWLQNRRILCRTNEW